MNTVGRLAAALVITAIVIITYVFAADKYEECEFEWTAVISILMSAAFAYLLVDKLIEWGLLA